MISSEAGFPAYGPGSLKSKVDALGAQLRVKDEEITDETLLEVALTLVRGDSFLAQIIVRTYVERIRQPKKSQQPPINDSPASPEISVADGWHQFFNHDTNDSPDVGW